MEDKDLIEAIVKLLSKKGWCTTNKENLLDKLQEILYEFEIVDEKIKKIRNVLV